MMKRLAKVMAMAIALGLAAVALSGCGWSGAVGGGALLALLLAWVGACGGTAVVDPGGTGSGSGGGGGEQPHPTPPDAGVNPNFCGDGVCPSAMSCGSVGGEPWCLPDADDDEVFDDEDNCPYADNPGQTDTDGDGDGDVCDLCPTDPGYDDACADPDGDGWPGADPYGGMMSPDLDNCPYVANADQADGDGDGIGDACDICPDELNPLSPCGDPCLDSDGDGVADFGFCGEGDTDSCELSPSDHLDDIDADDVGDVCDPDGIPPIAGSTAQRAPSPAQRRAQRLAILQRLTEQGILDPETARIAAG